MLENLSPCASCMIIIVGIYFYSLFVCIKDSCSSFFTALSTIPETGFIRMTAYATSPGTDLRGFQGTVEPPRLSRGLLKKSISDTSLRWETKKRNLYVKEVIAFITVKSDQNEIKRSGLQDHWMNLKRIKNGTIIINNGGGWGAK